MLKNLNVTFHNSQLISLTINSYTLKCIYYKIILSISLLRLSSILDITITWGMGGVGIGKGSRKLNHAFTNLPKGFYALINRKYAKNKF